MVMVVGDQKREQLIGQIEGIEETARDIRLEFVELYGIR